MKSPGHADIPRYLRFFLTLKTLGDMASNKKRFFWTKKPFFSIQWRTLVLSDLSQLIQSALILLK